MTANAIEPWTYTNTWGERLAVIRQHMRWNMAQAARACGTTDVSWRSWELENKSPMKLREVVENICAASGADRNWLMWGYNVGPGGALSMQVQGSEDRSNRTRFDPFHPREAEPVAA